jgi:hypothetical protein
MTRLRLLGLIAVFALGACAANQRQTHVASYPNGAPRWQAELRDGVPDGESTSWHENGQVASQGTYRTGERVGEFIYWDEAGRVVRRETYRGGAVVATDRAMGAPGLTAPVVALAPQPAPADHYTELRFSTGVGGTDAVARQGDGPGDAAEATMSLGVELMTRRKSKLYGAALQLQPAIFGATHTYLGGAFGLASPGTNVHAELIAEGGLHIVSQIGNDLFSSSSGSNSAELPYLGAKVRLSFDPGEPGNVVFDLSANARTDLGRTDRDVMVTSCFFGCSSSRESWRVGGQSMDFQLGMGYRF